MATSTYEVEFSAMCSGIEEVKSIRFMLRCLGIPVTSSSLMYGDNLGSIQSANTPKGILKKKHVALSYHVVREAIAFGVACPIWVPSASNHSDILTKQIEATPFIGHVHDCFWKLAHCQESLPSIS